MIRHGSFLLQYRKWFGRKPPMVQELLIITMVLSAAFVTVAVLCLCTVRPYGFTVPCKEWESHISSSFGARENPLNQQAESHKGIDIAIPLGSEVYAVQDGVVTLSEESDVGYGYHLMISHQGGFESLYAHCSELLVEQGQTVKRGQLIAKSGSTGESTGPHLHFELRKNGKAVNPRKYL